jgi:hypothetical protein
MVTHHHHTPSTLLSLILDYRTGGSFLASRRGSLFPSAEGTVEEDSQKLRSLRQSLTRETKDRVWVNLWKERESALDTILPGEEWAERVPEFNHFAETKARLLLAERLEQAVSEPRKRWETLAQQLKEKGTISSKEEAHTLDLILLSINQWSVYQEGAGFLAVNSNLVGAR